MTFEPGSKLGPYEILSLLGAGGMGEVWRARDTRLEREVALKVLPAETLGDGVARARLLREARTASKLNHPSVCTVHEVGEADGRAFIAMELVEGRTLSDRLAAGALSSEEVVRYGAQLADALAHAHAHGVVHRDFKSANVVLTPEGRGKVLDFGLAKGVTTNELGEATTLSRAPLTEDGTVAGTPAYMAPEQLQGRPVDERSDVWALGVVLYEMATGRRPFGGESGFELASAILTRPPARLPETVPRPLAAVIERCLVKEPAGRYQRGGEVSAALETLRAGRISSPRAALRISSRGRLFAGFAVVLAVLTAGLALFFVRRTGPRARTSAGFPPLQPRIVVLPFENLGSPDDAYFVSGMGEEITSRLANVRTLAVISRTTATQYDQKGKTVEQIGKDLGVGYVLEGSVRWDRSGDGPGRVRITPQLIRVADDTHLWSERYDRQLADIFAVQSDVADGVVRALNLALAPAESTALHRMPTGDLAAYDLYLRALELDKRRHEPTAIAQQIQLASQGVERDPKFAEALALLAGARTMNYWLFFDRRQSQLELARVEAEQAVALRPDSAETHLALGQHHFMGRLDFESALAEYGKALRLQPNSSGALLSIAAVYRRQGRWQEAEGLLRKALDGDPRSGPLWFLVGETQLILRKYPDAIRNMEISSSLDPNYVYGHTYQAWAHVLWHGDVAGSRRVLGAAAALTTLDDPGGIVDYFSVRTTEVARDWEAAARGLDAGKVEAATGQLFYVPMSLLRAEVLSFLGHHDQARQAYEKARGILVHRISETPEDSRLHSSLGLALAGLGQLAEAVREGERGVELLPPEKDAFRGAYRIEDLARIYAAAGNHEAAVRQLDLLLSRPSHVSVTLLKRDPWWDPLRKNPKFEALLAKYEVKP